MKLLLIALAIVLLTLIPIVLIGTKYRDGVFASNTYVKALDYDAGRKISEEADIKLSEPVCAADICRLDYVLGVEPDNNSLTVRVFRPAGNEELLLEAAPEYIKYKFTGDGWYILRLDYSKDGVWASEEKSLYIIGAA